MATSIIKGQTFTSLDIYMGNGNSLLGSVVCRNVDDSITNTPDTNGILIQFCPYQDIGYLTRVQFYISYNGDTYLRIHWGAGSSNWTAWKQLG